MGIIKDMEKTFKIKLLGNSNKKQFLNKCNVSDRQMGGF